MPTKQKMIVVDLSKIKSNMVNGPIDQMVNKNMTKRIGPLRGVRKRKLVHNL